MKEYVGEPMHGEARAEWREGWRIVLGAGLAVSFSFANFAYVASLFVRPLQDEFGWSRGQQAMMQNIVLLAAFLTPVIGSYADKIGTRAIAKWCVLGVALSYFGLSLMPGWFPAYLFLMSCLILIGNGTTGIVFSRAVVSWFDRSRGTALAVSRVGLSFSAAILPAIVFGAIDAFGWRAGYATLGLLTLLVAWPATLLWVHERPEVARAGRDSPGFSLRLYLRLLGNRKILLLIVAAALLMGPVVGLLSQLQPLLGDKGLEPRAAARIVGVQSFSVLIGTLVTGFLADRIWAPLIGFGMTAAGAIGFLLLAGYVHDDASAILAVFLVGVAQGAEIDLLGYLIARYFGLTNFAAIFGLSVMFLGFTGASSAIVMGTMYDRIATYDPVLWANVPLLMVSAVMFLALGRYPQKPQT